MAPESICIDQIAILTEAVDPRNSSNCCCESSRSVPPRPWCTSTDCLVMGKWP
jgi:hypothetical protein